MAVKKASVRGRFHRKKQGVALPLTASRHEGQDHRSRPPLDRMRRLNALLRSNLYPNCRTLSEELEVSEKTIQRDIDFLRDRYGAPIAYDSIRFGYFYTEPFVEFDRLEVSEGELISLFLVEHAMQQLRGTPYEKHLRSVCRKIQSGMDDKLSVNMSDVEAAISFRSTGPSRTDVAIFDAISHALFRSCEINFHYLKLGSDQLELRRAQPLHLGCVNDVWYCFAHDLDRDAIRRFALLRMRSVKVTRTKFVRPADFSVSKLLQQSFGIFCADEGSRVYRIRIRFDAFAARLVNERMWHESQVITPLQDGAIELALELSSFQEITRWILGWGGRARVLAPKRLRDLVHAEARAILEG